MTPEELVTAVSPALGQVGSAFYFIPDTVGRGKEVGLDGFRFYVLGRGGVLGDVEPAVVQSAFGYFAPGLVTKMWNTGRERTRLTPRDIGRIYVDCSQEFGRKHFAGLDLDDFNAAAHDLVGKVDPSGLALYAALAAEPLADDTPARAMQLATVLRELRGSLHLLAVVAGGVSPRVAHYFRRPNDFATFGYSEDEVPIITDADRSAIESVDSHTDQLVAATFALVDADQRQAIAHGVDLMAGSLA